MNSSPTWDPNRPKIRDPISGLHFTINFTSLHRSIRVLSVPRDLLLHAALISIFATITSSLASNDHVVVVALDFSKAFDTVRHSTLLATMAQLYQPRHSFQFNWLVDYFRGHEHCTGGIMVRCRRCSQSRRVQYKAQQSVLRRT